MIKIFSMFMLADAIIFACSYAFATACYYDGADGVRYYRQNTKTATLGTATKIKPCPDSKLIVPYDDARGMKLNVNPPPDGVDPCLRLLVKENMLSVYSLQKADGAGEIYCPD